MPEANQVFEAGGFVVCSFVPSKVDYHPLSVPVPYYHSNVVSDEVMFYCGGHYKARKGSGIGPGSVSLHPGGEVKFFEERAVMLDTFQPLLLGEAATACDDGQYAWNWAKAEHER